MGGRGRMSDVASAHLACPSPLLSSPPPPPPPPSLHSPPSPPSPPFRSPPPGRDLEPGGARARAGLGERDGVESLRLCAAGAPAAARLVAVVQRP
eukprot:136964-Pyramimonas_sp.AAC.1